MKASGAQLLYVRVDTMSPSKTRPDLLLLLLRLLLLGHPLAGIETENSNTPVRRAGSRPLALALASKALTHTFALPRGCYCLCYITIVHFPLWSTGQELLHRPHADYIISLGWHAVNGSEIGTFEISYSVDIHM